MPTINGSRPLTSLHGSDKAHDGDKVENHPRKLSLGGSSPPTGPGVAGKMGESGKALSRWPHLLG